MAQRTDQLCPSVHLATFAQFFETRALLALSPRHSTEHVLSLLDISQAAYHRDTATKPQLSTDGVLLRHDLTTSAGDLSPRRQLVLRMRATPPL